MYKSHLAKAIEELETLKKTLEEGGETEKEARKEKFIKEQCYFLKPKGYVEPIEEEKN